MKRRFKLDNRKDSYEKISEKLQDPNTVVKEMTVTLGEGLYDNEPVTSEGWKNELIDELWRASRLVNAGRSKTVFRRAHTAELWSCEVLLYSPKYYTGWRKWTKKLADWLSGL